jgi:hypothetical protein
MSPEIFFEIRTDLSDLELNSLFLVLIDYFKTFDDSSISINDFRHIYGDKILNRFWNIYEKIKNTLFNFKNGNTIPYKLSYYELDILLLVILDLVMFCNEGEMIYKIFESSKSIEYTNFDTVELLNRKRLFRIWNILKGNPKQIQFNFISIYDLIWKSTNNYKNESSPYSHIISKFQLFFIIYVIFNEISIGKTKLIYYDMKTFTWIPARKSLYTEDIIASMSRGYDIISDYLDYFEYLSIEEISDFAYQPVESIKINCHYCNKLLNTSFDIDEKCHKECIP